MKRTNKFKAHIRHQPGEHHLFTSPCGPRIFKGTIIQYSGGFQRARPTPGSPCRAVAGTKTGLEQVSSWDLLARAQCCKMAREQAQASVTDLSPVCLQVPGLVMPAAEPGTSSTDWGWHLPLVCGLWKQVYGGQSYPAWP